MVAGVVLVTMSKTAMEVVVAIGVVAQDDAAGFRIDRHPLDAGNSAEGLLDLFQQLRISLGGRNLHPNPPGHLVGDLKFDFHFWSTIKLSGSRLRT